MDYNVKILVAFTYLPEPPWIAAQHSVEVLWNWRARQTNKVLEFLVTSELLADIEPLFDVVY